MTQQIEKQLKNAIASKSDARIAKVYDNWKQKVSARNVLNPLFLEYGIVCECTMYTTTVIHVTPQKSEYINIQIQM